MTELGTATNMNLLDIYNMMKDGSLILRPRFQRKLVWNDKHKESFIETILMGLPFPEIYLADGEIDLESQTLTRLVVDGQQRLSTIRQYITGSKEFEIERIEKFSKLSGDQQKSFFNYKIIVRALGKIDDETTKEIFKRINSVQYALNAIEIQNALYEGEFISTAKEISQKGQVVANLFDVFSETEFTRMRDIEFITLVMSTLEENGYFGGNSLVEGYVKDYDSKYPNKSEMKRNIRDVFKLIPECQLELDSIWFRKSSFFTLVVELLKYRKMKGFLPDSNSTTSTLKRFEKRVYRAKTSDITKNRFAEYYYYTFQGTNGRTGRNVRGKLLAEHLNTLT